MLFAPLIFLSSLAWTTSAYGFHKRATTPAMKPPKDMLPPSKDPFYKAPPGYKEVAPGTVLRVRSAPGLAKAANITTAYNILYRTTDSNYKPSWAVTTLYVPPAAALNASAKGTKLLSYQVPYDSANVDDSPSYTFYNPAAVDPSITAGLSLGWYVSVPDYEGPKASFTAGVQSGHATIDAVRAVRRPRFGIARDARTALWGYSGGALASEWAAELQIQYAPELALAGVALGGLTPNISNVALTVSGTPGAELVVNGILGLISQDPAAEAYVRSQLKTAGPLNATGFFAARTVNTTVDLGLYFDQNIFDYFTSGRAILQAPLVRALLDRDGLMGYHGVPAEPVFAYKAIKDEVSPVADTDKLIARYCEVGANILYQRNTVGGHTAEAYNGGRTALAFVDAVLDGTYAAKYQSEGCTVQNVTVAVDTSPL